MSNLSLERKKERKREKFEYKPRDATSFQVITSFADQEAEWFPSFKSCNIKVGRDLRGRIESFRRTHFGGGAEGNRTVIQWQPTTVFLPTKPNTKSRVRYRHLEETMAVSSLS